MNYALAPQRIAIHWLSDGRFAVEQFSRSATRRAPRRCLGFLPEQFWWDGVVVAVTSITLPEERPILKSD